MKFCRLKSGILADDENTRDLLEAYIKGLDAAVSYKCDRLS